MGTSDRRLLVVFIKEDGNRETRFDEEYSDPLEAMRDVIDFYASAVATPAPRRKGGGVSGREGSRRAERLND